jgi:hypothetical protein
MIEKKSTGAPHGSPGAGQSIREPAAVPFQEIPLMSSSLLRHYRTLTALALALAAAPSIAACSSGDIAIGEQSEDELRRRDAGPALDGGPVGPDAGCPSVTPPAPGFCFGGTIKPHVENGCTLGYDCINPANDAGPAANTCTAAGGECRALSLPQACDNWGSASQYSCGGGVGVGCCLPSCPELVQPGPGYCTNGNIVTKTNAAGCTYYDCVLDGGPAMNPCVAGGGSCIGLVPSACPAPQSWSSLSCGGGVGVGCCL